jgi:hypothetical protein
VSVGGEALLQLAVVLDDPVQHDRDLLRLAAGKRVRVLLRHAAVRRPACVTETGGRRRAVETGAGLQVLEGADGPDVRERAPFEERQAGGVVPAVLQALEPLQQQRLALTRPDVSDDAAHSGGLLESVRARRRPSAG